MPKSEKIIIKRRLKKSRKKANKQKQQQKEKERNKQKEEEEKKHTKTQKAPPRNSLENNKLVYRDLFRSENTETPISPTRVLKLEQFGK